MLKVMMIAGLAVAAPLQAAGPMPRWTPVGTDAAGRTIEIDRNSLNWRTLQRAWWRFAPGAARAGNAVEERHLELIDCSAGTSAAIQTIALGADGTILRNQEDGEALALQRLGPPTPDTTGEMVAMESCRLRPPPPKVRKR